MTIETKLTILFIGQSGITTLVLLLIALKVRTYGKTRDLLKRNSELIDIAERLLRMAQTHGSITDRAKYSTESAVKIASEEVKKVVEKVPNKTAEIVMEKVKELGTSDSHHGEVQ